MMEKQGLNKDSNPFRVPENYFDDLNERILRNTEALTPGSSRKGVAILRPYLSLAAIIAGAALLTLAVVKLSTGFQRDVRPGEDMYADIPQFLIDGMDMYMIEQELYGEYETDMSLPPENKEEIIEYLMLNEVDLSLIYDFIGDNPKL
ncbi:MAG: hypothetical protein IH591_01445 [Bacteroidales bacterium]|nr:hypothetical protein [Bacteroidales bacterium]